MSIIMGIFITIGGYDLLKINGDNMELWIHNKYLSYACLRNESCRFINDPNNLINNMSLLSNDRIIKTIRDKRLFDIDTNQRELLNALCNGNYYIIRCKSTIKGSFDVAYSKIMTVSQIKSTKYGVYEKIMLCISYLCEKLCYDIMRVVIITLMNIELLDYYVTCDPIVGIYYHLDDELLLQNHADFIDYVKNNYHKLFYF